MLILFVQQSNERYPSYPLFHSNVKTWLTYKLNWVALKREITNLSFPYSVICSEMQKKLWKVKLTVCISDLDLVLKSSSHSNAKNHKYPIDVRDVNLPKEFFWSVHNTDTGKTTQRKSLLYNRVGSRYGGLTCNYCCKSCNDEGWPIYGICSDQSSYNEYIIEWWGMHYVNLYIVDKMHW